MTADTDVPQLKQIEIDMIRLIARGLGNEEIAKIQGVPLHTMKSRLKRLHRLLGTSASPSEQTILGRVRIVIWAYEQGLVEGKPAVPPEYREAFIGFCQSVVNNQPRGDLRQWAEKGLRAAGVDQPNKRRFKPRTPA